MKNRFIQITAPGSWSVGAYYSVGVQIDDLDATESRRIAQGTRSTEASASVGNDVEAGLFQGLLATVRKAAAACTGWFNRVPGEALRS